MHVVIDEYPLSDPPTVYGPFADKEAAESFEGSLADDNNLTVVVPLTTPHYN